MKIPDSHFVHDVDIPYPHREPPTVNELLEEEALDRLGPPDLRYPGDLEEDFSEPNEALKKALMHYRDKLPEPTPVNELLTEDWEHYLLNAPIDARFERKLIEASNHISSWETNTPKYGTREEYLAAFVRQMRPRLAGLGFILPDAIRVSIGFPSKGGLSRTRKKLGETWAFEASKDGSLEVFISPVVESPLEALVVLCGQLGYCAVGANDKDAFKRYCGALGLCGRPATLWAGDELKSFLEKKLDDLGPFPGSPLNPDAIIKDTAEKKPGSRMLKAQCEAPDCGYTIRLAAKWVERGLPQCVCGMKFIGPEITNDGEVIEGAIAEPSK